MHSLGPILLVATPEKGVYAGAHHARAMQAAQDTRVGKRQHVYREALNPQTFERAYLQFKVQDAVQIMMPIRRQTFDVSRPIEVQIDEVRGNFYFLAEFVTGGPQSWQICSTK